MTQTSFSAELTYIIIRLGLFSGHESAQWYIATSLSGNHSYWNRKWSQNFISSGSRFKRPYLRHYYQHGLCGNLIVCNLTYPESVVTGFTLRIEFIFYIFCFFRYWHIVILISFLWKLHTVNCVCIIGYVIVWSTQ